MPFFNTHTDLELLEEIRQGNEKAFQFLFEQHYQSIVIQCTRLVKEQDLAEDIVQEVFVKFWQNATDLTIKQSVKGYLWMMTRNKSLDHLRKKSYQSDEELPFVGENDTDQLEYQELERHVNQIIDALPERCRQVFVLSRFEEMSYKEIAKELDISTKTVENQISKALKSMRKGLKSFFSLTFF